MPTCLIALGSNLGDRRATLDAAVRWLGDSPAVEVVRASRWHATTPVGGPPGQGEFLNGAAVVETSLSPEAILDVLQQVEARLGRQRRERWGPRSLDLDLLLYGDRVYEGPGIRVPHPRMAWRRFVLEPAAEIAAQMRHPGIGWTIGELLRHLDEAPRYLAVTGGPGVGKTQLGERLAGRLAGRFLPDPAGLALRREGEEMVAFRSAKEAQGDRGWTMELEVLAQRERAIGEALAGDVSHAAWTVSDFWLGQALVYGGLDLPADRQAELHRRWQAAQRAVAAPKLLVVLAATDRPESERRDRIQRAFADWAGRPGWGPILRLPAQPADETLAEILAAVESM